MEIPAAKDTDAEDVAWGLQTAETLWKRGERIDALVWLRRAAQAAGDASDDDRALELARQAAELTEWMSNSADAGLAPPVEAADSIPAAPWRTPSQEPPRPPPPRPPSQPTMQNAHPPEFFEPQQAAAGPGSVDPASDEGRPSATSVPPAEKVHAGMFDPWADQSSQLAPPTPEPPIPPAPKTAPLPLPPVRQPSIVDLEEEEEEVITSVRPQGAQPSSDAPVALPVAPPPRPSRPAVNRPSVPRPPPPLPARARPPLPKPSPVLAPPAPESAPESGSELIDVPVSLAPPPPEPGGASDTATPVDSESAEPAGAPAPGTWPPSPSAAVPDLPPYIPPPEELASVPPAPPFVPEEPALVQSDPVPVLHSDPIVPSEIVAQSEASGAERPRAAREAVEAQSEASEASEASGAEDAPEAHQAESAPEPAAPASVRPEPPAASASLDLESVESFADLPDDARTAFAAAATLHTLAEGDEIGTFALAYIISGTFDVSATMVDSPAVRLRDGAVLRARGTTEEGVPMRLISTKSGSVVATWSDASVEEAFRSIPWVEEDLRAAADRVQTLVGITIGPLGERLDVSIREEIVGRLKMRPLAPAEIVVNEGEAVPGLLLVGIGELELIKDNKVTGTVGSGEFLFPTEVLGAGSAPATARAGAGGALVLFGDRNVAQELLVTCPPLLEVFAGM